MTTKPPTASGNRSARAFDQARNPRCCPAANGFGCTLAPCASLKGFAAGQDHRDHRAGSWDAHQSLLATRMAPEGHAARLRGHRPGRLLSVECWGHLRRLHPLSTKTPGSACAPSAARRPTRGCRCRCGAEPARLPALRRHWWIDRFDKVAENGMDVFRVFDAPNDLRNIRHSLQAVRATASTPRAPSATPPRCTPCGLRRHGPPGWSTSAAIRCASKGHGGAAQAPAGLRHRPGHQGGLRRRGAACMCTPTPPPA